AIQSCPRRGSRTFGAECRKALLATPAARQMREEAPWDSICPLRPAQSTRHQFDSANPQWLPIAHPWAKAVEVLAVVRLGGPSVVTAVRPYRRGSSLMAAYISSPCSSVIALSNASKRYGSSRSASTSLASS